MARAPLLHACATANHGHCNISVINYGVPYFSLIAGKYVQIDDALMNQYRNMGGFDIIGSGRDKIEVSVVSARRSLATDIQRHGKLGMAVGVRM